MTKGNDWRKWLKEMTEENDWRKWLMEITEGNDDWRKLLKKMTKENKWNKFLSTFKIKSMILLASILFTNIIYNPKKFN
jgi:hypothetical protein